MNTPQDGMRMHALRRLLKLRGPGPGAQAMVATTGNDPMAMWRMMSKDMAAKAMGPGVPDPRNALRQRLLAQRLSRRSMPVPDVGTAQNSGLPMRGY